MNAKTSTVRYTEISVQFMKQFKCLDLSGMLSSNGK